MPVYAGSLEMSFRRLSDDDLPMMHRWLNDPAVVRWWEGRDVSWPAVVGRFGPIRLPTPIGVIRQRLLEP